MVIIPPAPRCGASSPPSSRPKVTGALFAATIRFDIEPSLPVPTVLSAPDKWRGSATAADVAAAVERAAARHGWTVDSAPISDGGEGFTSAVGVPNRSSRVTGPLGGQVDAPWLLGADAAFLEMALASGLALAGGAGRNDALAATSRGTGELIAAALDTGAAQIVVGLGGSACTDGGLGCYEVLRADARLGRVGLIAACDVMVPFGGAVAFASQKGASDAETRLLEGRLERVAQIYETERGVDVRALPGAGAAGGLGGGLAALGAELVRGIEVVAEAIGFAERLAACDLVVTGEGLIDEHTFQGKAVGWILERAAEAAVPALVVVGDRDFSSQPDWLSAAAVDIVTLVERFGSEQARSNTLGCIDAVVDEYLRR